MFMHVCINYYSHKAKRSTHQGWQQHKSVGTNTNWRELDNKSIQQIAWIASLLWPLTSLAIGFDHVYSIRNEFPSGDQASNAIKRLVGYPHKLSCTVAQLVWQVSVAALGKTIDVFSSSAAYIALSITMKASHKRELLSHNLSGSYNGSLLFL